MSTKNVVVTYIDGERVAELLAHNAPNINRLAYPCDKNIDVLSDKIKTWYEKNCNFFLLT